MENQFLQLLSDEAAAPRSEFKAELLEHLELGSNVAVKKSTSPLKVQLIMIAAVSAALIALTALFLLQRQSVEIGQETIQKDSSDQIAQVVQQQSLVKGAQNDSTPSSSAEVDEPLLVVQVQDLPPAGTSVAEPLTDKKESKEQPKSVIVAPVKVTVCRDEQLIEINESNRLIADFDPPCADSEFTAWFWNLPKDGRALDIPNRTPDAIRQDEEVNFMWGDASPEIGIQSDLFTVQWTKKQRFTEGGYTIQIVADDGVRFFIDDILVIEGWGKSGLMSYKSKHIFTEGVHDIRLQYYDIQNDARVSLVITPA